jgi:hypothetical protein
MRAAQNPSADSSRSRPTHMGALFPVHACRAGMTGAKRSFDTTTHALRPCGWFKSTPVGESGLRRNIVGRHAVAPIGA